MRSVISAATASRICELVDGRQYLVEGSSGAGNRADMPWICIFDRDITESATYSIYICYLFRADMTGAYLSLN